MAQTSVASGQILVKVGDPAPGLPAGTTFFSLGAPSINANGEVAFVAAIAGPGVSASNNSTLWSGAAGQLQLVAREGSPAPGTEPGVVFYAFRDLNAVPPIISKDGSTAFSATLSGPGVGSSNRDGIWRGRPGSVQLVARTGDPAPDTEAGTLYAGLETSAGEWTASDGGVAFLASLTGPAIGPLNGSGLWAGLPGEVALLARAGSQAPGLPAGSKIRLINADPVINNLGEVLFRADTGGSSSADAIYFGTPGAVEPVALIGEPTPEVGAGVSIYSIGQSDEYGINDSGLASFGVTLHGGSLTGSPSASIWRGDSSNRDLMARSTDPAPGTGAANFDGFANSAINRDGVVAIKGDVSTSSSVYGVWLGTPGDLDLLALPGSVIPTPVGDLVLEHIDSAPLVNGQGEIAFSGNVSLGGAAARPAIVLGTPGDLRPAVVSGQPFDVGGGVIRTPTFGHTGFRGPNTGNEDGRPSGFSDNGQVAFLATLPERAIILAPRLNPNKLTNGGFETGAIAPWAALAGFSASGASKHAGAYAGRFQAGATGTTWQQVPVTAGRSYDLSGWVNLPSQGTLILKVQWRGSASTTVVIRRFTKATAGWVNVTNANPLVAPAGAKTVRVQVAVQNLQSAVYVDDLSLVER